MRLLILLLVLVPATMASKKDLEFCADIIAGLRKIGRWLRRKIIGKSGGKQRHLVNFHDYLKKMKSQTSLKSPKGGRENIKLNTAMDYYDDYRRKKRMVRAEDFTIRKEIYEMLYSFDYYDDENSEKTY